MARTGLVALAVAHLVGAAFACAFAQGVPLPPRKPAQPNPRPAATHEMPPVPARPPGEVVAYDGSQRALVDRVSTYLSSVQTMSGDFVQIGPDGSRTTGKFHIQKPGRVRFEYEPPSPIDIVSDGSSVVVRDRRLATQDSYPLSQTPLRFLLADRIDLVRDTNLVAVAQDRNFVSVLIEERHLLVGTHRLLLMFSARDMQLRQWTVTDPQGYDTTIAVYNIDTAHRPDPNLFNINYQR